jgi:hypothetical protein
VAQYGVCMSEHSGSEEIWIGNQHVATVRKAPGHETHFIIEAVDGTELHQAENQHLAEVWVSQHADDIVGRLG